MSSIVDLVESELTRFPDIINHILVSRILSFFFFQAEDGIRDYKVTGVQTCALPILRAATTAEQAGAAYRVAARLLDRAARKNLIHHNNAARHKSRLAAVVRKLSK